ncbi:hypothetical protein K2E96_29865 [Pseudomonas sp. ERGC3:05]|nr:hypothetical protein [Pseudomonas sp. ERGC3:01]QZC94770.1 hypothetical protein K2E96_29865 [Pseudomonas sp. ERGC3:05]
MKYVAFLLTLALMVGCKMPPAPGDTTSVPLVRIYGFSKKSDAQLVIVSNPALGNSCAIRISIDGKPAADFFPAELAHFGVTIGAHRLSARSSAGCEHWEQEIKIKAKAGDAVIVRIDETGLAPIVL